MASSSEEWRRYGGSGASEIEEEMIMSRDEEEELKKINKYNEGGMFELGSIMEEAESRRRSWCSDFEERDNNVVYVAVWKESDDVLSMDALTWTLHNAIVDPSSALVFLVHVFPETKYIPSPLGKLPINQVNQEQKEKFLAQERAKKRDLLQKFLNVCSASQVKVETILIESDMEAKAIIDLIPILNIRKLVLGASKATIRRMRSKKGNGAADKIAQNAPEFCEVKIICEGKEMPELTMMEPPSPSPSPSPRATHSTPPNQQRTTKESSAWGCFKI